MINITERIDERRLEKLIRDMGEGDNVSFREFYCLTDKSIFGYALSILKNVHDAEDVMQDTYLQIRAAAYQYESKGKAFAWIFTITRNLCLMKLRTRKKWAYGDISDYEDLQSEQKETDIEDKIILQTMLSKLNEQERQIVTLHAMTGMKHREIAKIVGIPLATVLTKYARAIAKLKKETEYN